MFSCEGRGFINSDWVTEGSQSSSDCRHMISPESTVIQREQTSTHTHLPEILHFLSSFADDAASVALVNHHAYLQLLVVNCARLPNTETLTITHSSLTDATNTAVEHYMASP